MEQQLYNFFFNIFFEDERFKNTMGLLLKIKKSQKKQWDFFIQCAIESYQEGKLIILPLGKGGYGFIGNIYNSSCISHLTQVFTLYGNEKSITPLFLVESIEIAQKLGIISSLGELILHKFWPRELILRVPINENSPIITKIQKDNSKYDDFIFPNHNLDIMQISNPVCLQFMKKLRMERNSEFLFGVFAEIEPGRNCLDVVTLLEMFSSANNTTILDFGNLQKGKQNKPPTIVECLDEDNASIIQDGLVPEDEIITYFEEMED